MGKLTAKQVENLSVPGTYEDGEGLRLFIQATGRKSWVFRFQLNARRREMGLGGFPQVSLKDARLACSAFRIQLSSGVDPLAARDAERAARKLAQQETRLSEKSFETVAREYFEAHSGAWSERWRKGWIRKLEHYAFDRIGTSAPKDVQTEDVLSILRPIWAVKSRTADEVRSQIEQILDAAKARGLRSGENPARWKGHLENLLSRLEKKKARTCERFIALNWKDAPKLMHQLDELRVRNAQALQLLLLTGARSHMVRFARWEEFDLVERVWRLDESRMKTRQAFAIPLSEEVLRLLEAIPRISDSQYLFPGHGRSGVMHGNAMRDLLQEDLAYQGVTCHGFRSTFRDWAGECTNYPRYICELALAHDERGTVESSYSRSDFLEKRRPLMADWAKYLSSFQSPGA